jgi:hypothetical protein
MTKEEERLDGGTPITEGSLPDGRDAARPGAPAAQRKKNRRIEPDPQGHARLIDLREVLAREIEASAGKGRILLLTRIML